jgi:hypothetical protein
MVNPLVRRTSRLFIVQIEVNKQFTNGYSQRRLLAELRQSFRAGQFEKRRTAER